MIYKTIHIKQMTESRIKSTKARGVISSVGGGLTLDKDHTASSLEYHRYLFILKISATTNLLANLSGMISTFSTRQMC